MKKTILLISILILMFSGILFSDQTKLPDPVPILQTMDISGKINAIMTDIPLTQEQAMGMSSAFIKVKVKDDKTGMEHSIQIAPGNFLKLNGILLQKNDLIKVKAFKSGNSIEMKSLEINVKGKILKIRDKFGKGLWEKPKTTIKKNPFKR